MSSCKKMCVYITRHQKWPRLSAERLAELLADRLARRCRTSRFSAFSSSQRVSNPAPNAWRASAVPKPNRCVRRRPPTPRIASASSAKGSARLQANRGRRRPSTSPCPASNGMHRTCAAEAEAAVRLTWRYDGRNCTTRKTISH